jgi:hypothetical protein
MVHVAVSPSAQISENLPSKDQEEYVIHPPEADDKIRQCIIR